MIIHDLQTNISELGFTRLETAIKGRGIVTKEKLNVMEKSKQGFKI